MCCIIHFMKNSLEKKDTHKAYGVSSLEHLNWSYRTPRQIQYGMETNQEKPVNWSVSISKEIYCFSFISEKPPLRDLPSISDIIFRTFFSPSPKEQITIYNIHGGLQGNEQGGKRELTIKHLKLCFVTLTWNHVLSNTAT